MPYFRLNTSVENNGVISWIDTLTLNAKSVTDAIRMATEERQAMLDGLPGHAELLDDRQYLVWVYQKAKETEEFGAIAGHTSIPSLSE